MKFIDTNFQSDHDDSKSVSGYIFILNDEAICWNSFKQHTVADFIWKAEYIATSDAVKEAVWLWKFIDELEVALSIDDPILLYCDNTGAIAQAKESRFHQRTKHILRRYHLIREIMDQVDVDLQKINKKENLANPFTKALKIKKFDDHKLKMVIRYCTDWL